jgi:hypothetical protein
MPTRTTARTVTFAQPFVLAGMEAEWPAGDYLVETDEELIEPLSFIAYRRTATWIHSVQGAGRNAEVVRVDPKELEAVLLAMRPAPPA